MGSAQLRRVDRLVESHGLARGGGLAVIWMPDESGVYPPCPAVEPGGTILKFVRVPRRECSDSDTASLC